VVVTDLGLRQSKIEVKLFGEEKPQVWAELSGGEK
jgi:hypothetical protein